MIELILTAMAIFFTAIITLKGWVHYDKWKNRKKPIVYYQFKYAPYHLKQQNNGKQIQPLRRNP